MQTLSPRCAAPAPPCVISDGDVAGVIHTADPENSGVDIYISTGGAPEGVLAAAALRCIGGQMQCRLVLDTDEKRERAVRMGVTAPRMIFSIEDMVKGDCLFAATGVTTGALVSGVKFRRHFIETETIVMRSVTGTVRIIRGSTASLKNFTSIEMSCSDHGLDEGNLAPGGPAIFTRQHGLFV